MYEDTEIADVMDRLDRARRERYLAEMQQAEQERETVRSEAYGAPDTSHVLQFLSYFDRPRNAIATAVKEGGLGGFVRGLTGETETSWGDVLGIEKPGDDDSWPGWMGKATGRFALDLALDPLNLLAAPVKGASLMSRGLKAAKVPEALTWAAGTKPGKHIFQSLPSGVPENELAEAGLAAGRRVGGEKKLDIIDALNATKAAEQAAGEGKSLEELRQTWNLTPDALPPEISEAYAVQKAIEEGMIDPINEFRGRFNLPLRQKLGEGGMNPVNWDPLVAKEGARRQAALSGKAGGGPVGDTPHRELRVLLDPEEAALGGRKLVREDLPYSSPADVNPIIMKPEFVQPARDVIEEAQRATQNPFSWSPGRQMISEGGPAIGQYNGNPVALGVPTYQEVKQALPELDFVRGAGESYGLSSARKADELAYLQGVANLEDKGIVIDKVSEYIGLNYPNYGRLPIDQQKKIWDIATARVRHPASMRVLEEQGIRFIDVPGLEHLAAPKAVANRLENSAVKMFDPETSMGSVATAMQKFMDQTKLGQTLKDVQSTWVGSNLPLFPGFHVANVASNQGLLYGGGVNPLKIPYRDLQATAVQKGWENIPGIEGRTNAQLQREFAARGLGEPGALFGEGNVKDVLRTAVTEGEPSIGQRLFQGLGIPEEYAQGMAKPFEALGRAQDVGFRVGGAAESNAKIAAAIDWMTKNSPDFAKLAPEEQARILDAAAEHAKFALADPSVNLTPFDQTVMRTLFPFWGWTKSMAAKTGQQALYEPWKLGRLGRFEDYYLQPLSPEEKEVAPDYLKEQGPIKGAFGMPLSSLPLMTPDPEGNPLVAFTGRFQPHGQVEQLLSRPLDTLTSMVNPIFKAPVEIATNRSAYKNRGIDELAGGAVSGMVNPMIGGPYQLSSQRIAGQDVPAAWDYALSQAPGGRYLATANEMGRGAGLWEDPNKRPAGGPETMLWWLTGGKTYPFDEFKYEKQAQNKQRESENKVKYLIKRADMLGNQPAVDFYEKELDRIQGGRRF